MKKLHKLAAYSTVFLSSLVATDVMSGDSFDISDLLPDKELPAGILSEKQFKKGVLMNRLSTTCDSVSKLLPCRMPDGAVRVVSYDVTNNILIVCDNLDQYNKIDQDNFSPFCRKFDKGE